MLHTVHEHKFTSGARGLVVDVPGASVVNFEVRFNSGFQFADRHIYELPHVVEHMIGCGSKLFPGPNEFKVEVQKNGAFRNAYTSTETNGYVLEFAAFELDRMLELVEQWLVEPLFPAEALPTELSNVREELNRLEADHDAECAYNLTARTFPHKSLELSRHIEQLPTITRHDVTDYYHRTHTQGNARFYIAGDLEKLGQDLPARIERLLGRLPKGDRLVLDETAGLGQTSPILERREVTTIHYRFASYAGRLTRQERNALLLARMILFNGFSSRIYGEARRRGLAYHVGGSASAVGSVSSLGINGFVTADNIGALFDLIAGEYRALKEGKLKAEELDAAKDRLVGSTLRSYQTPADILSWYVGRYDAEGEIYSLAEQLADLREIQPAEVVAMAAAVVPPGNQAISFVGNLNQTQAESFYGRLSPLWQS